MENLILNAANGDLFTEELNAVSSSVYGTDLDVTRLAHHIAVLPYIVQQALPKVKQVTSIRTVCTAITSNLHRSAFHEMHKLIWLNLTVPITSATSERAFSTLKRLLTYLHSSMTENRLNNCCLLHIHKDILHEMDLTPIAAAFTSANDECQHYFGSFQ